MTKYKQIGIVLILIGFFLPLISFTFADGYNPRLGFWWSVPKMNVNLWKTQNLPRPSPNNPNIVPAEDLPDELKPSVTLPFKYPFSLGIFTILVGIGFAVLPKHSKKT